MVEYATTVWHGCLTEEQSKKLESILKSVCRIILGAKYNSYTDSLDLTGLQTLSNRRIQLCTKFAVDCTRSDRYSEWFPLNNKTHGMTLRWSRTYQTLRSRTLRYGKSPLPYLCDCKQRKGACYACSDRPADCVLLPLYIFGCCHLYGWKGGRGALVSWLFCDFILCLWCNVGSAIGIESIIQFSIQIFFKSQLFIWYQLKYIVCNTTLSNIIFFFMCV